MNQLILLFYTFLLFNSCGFIFKEDSKLNFKKSNRAKNNSPLKTNAVITLPSYESLHKNLFVMSCNQCHAKNFNPDFSRRARKRTFDNYLNAKKYAERAYLRIMDTEDPMPNQKAIDRGAAIPTVEKARALYIWSEINYPKTDEEALEKTKMQELANYQWIYKNLLTPNCLNCHNGVKAKSYLSYKNTTQFGPQILAKINNDHYVESWSPIEKQAYLFWTVLGHPKDPEQYLQFFSIWRKKGQIEPTQELNKIKPLRPSYSSLKYHLYQKSCLQCHGQNYTIEDAEPKLDSYEQAIEHAQACLWEMEDGNMPPETPQIHDIPRPSREILEVFARWMELDFPLK